MQWLKPAAKPLSSSSCLSARILVPLVASMTQLYSRKKVPLPSKAISAALHFHLGDLRQAVLLAAGDLPRQLAAGIGLDEFLADLLRDIERRVAAGCGVHGFALLF